MGRRHSGPRHPRSAVRGLVAGSRVSRPWSPACKSRWTGEAPLLVKHSQTHMGLGLGAQRPARLPFRSPQGSARPDQDPTDSLPPAGFPPPVHCGFPEGRLNLSGGVRGAGHSTHHFILSLLRPAFNFQHFHPETELSSGGCASEGPGQSEEDELPTCCHHRRIG